MQTNEIKSYLDAVLFCKNHLNNKSICKKSLAVNEAMLIVAYADRSYTSTSQTAEDMPSKHDEEFSTPQKSDIITKLNHPIDKRLINTILTILDKRTIGLPYAYINMKKAFYGLEFDLVEEVLIPRYDSEVIFDHLDKLQLNQNIKVLDLGCGSGVLGLTILNQFKQAKLTATDISFEALRITKKNAKQLNLHKRISLVQANWQDPFLEKPFFDIVISNPPYIKTAKLDANSINKNAKKYQNLDFLSLNFEPKLALDGGLDGLDCYRTFAKNISRLIKPNCFLILEIGANQQNIIISLFENSLEFNYFMTVCDLSAIPRFLIFRKKSFF